MDKLLFTSFLNYFNTLEVTGYVPYNQMQQLLILNLYKEILRGDYDTYLTEEDRKVINRALDCIYGSTCLIPYPDYTKG